MLTPTLAAVLTQLRAEHSRLTRVIEELEELERRSGSDTSLPPKKRGRKGLSLQERRDVSARMKEYWSRKRGEANSLPGKMPVANPKPRA